MDLYTMESSHDVVVWNASVLNTENDANEECSICYESFFDKTYVNDCLHYFCKECILTWVKVKPVCPLCVQPVTAVIYNIRSLDDYDVEKILSPKTDVLAHYYENNFPFLDDLDNDMAVDHGSTVSDNNSYYDSSSNSEDFEPYPNDEVSLNSPRNLINMPNIVDDIYGNSQVSFVNYGTVEDDQSDILSVDSFSENNESSSDENDDDKDEFDCSENENENNEYYEENNYVENDYEDNNNTYDDYEGDEEDFQVFNFSDNEEEYETSNFCDNYSYYNTESDSNEENENVSSEYYEAGSSKDEDEECDYIKNDDEYSKYSYVNNTDSDQDSISYDETAAYIYSDY